MRITEKTSMCLATYDLPALDQWYFPFPFIGRFSEDNNDPDRIFIRNYDYNEMVNGYPSLQKKLQNNLWKEVYDIMTSPKYTPEEILEKLQISSSAPKIRAINTIALALEQYAGTEEELDEIKSSVEKDFTSDEVDQILALLQEKYVISQNFTAKDLFKYLSISPLPELVRAVNKIVSELEEKTEIEEIKVIVEDHFNSSQVEKIKEYLDKITASPDDFILIARKLKKSIFQVRGAYIKPTIINILLQYGNKAYFPYDPSWKLKKEVSPHSKYLDSIKIDIDTGLIKEVVFRVTLPVFNKDDKVEKPRKTGKISVARLLTNTRGQIISRLRYEGFNHIQRSVFIIPKTNALAPRDPNGKLVGDPCDGHTFEEIIICAAQPVYDLITGYLYEKNPKFEKGDLIQDKDHDFFSIKSHPKHVSGDLWADILDHKSGKTTFQMIGDDYRKPKPKYTVGSGKYLRSIGDFEDWTFIVEFTPNTNKSINDLVRVMTRNLISNPENTTFERIKKSLDEAFEIYEGRDPAVINAGQLQKRIRKMKEKYFKSISNYPFAIKSESPSKGWYYTEPVTPPSIAGETNDEDKELVEMRNKIETGIHDLEKLSEKAMQARQARKKTIVSKIAKRVQKSKKGRPRKAKEELKKQEAQPEEEFEEISEDLLQKLDKKYSDEDLDEIPPEQI